MSDPAVTPSESWRRNAYVLAVASFLTLVSFSMVLPFLPFYLQEMGVRSHLETWSGLIFGASFLTGGLMSPVWGSLGDRFGRKAMVLRSGFSIAAVNILMAFAATPLQLLGLRAVNGFLGGFLPASNALVASGTPVGKVGQGLGLIQVGTAAGTITGPLLGGLLADTVGVRMTFFGSSALMLVATALVWFLVEESFARREASLSSLRGLPREVGEVLAEPVVRRVLLTIFLAQAGAAGVQPVIALFVKDMAGTANASLATGAIFASAGLAQVLATPAWSRLGERVSLPKLLKGNLLGAGLATFLQGLSLNAMELAAARFTFGMAQAGITQSANTLLARTAAPEARGRAYGLASSAWMLGVVAGPVLGGLAAGRFGLGAAFWVAGLLLLTTAALRSPVMPHQVSRD